MKKNNINVFIISLLILGIFSFSISELNRTKETVTTSLSNVSTKKIEWGIKREKDNKQPDVGSANRKMLDENNGIYLGNVEKKYVYLTFDEGYEAGYTKQILKTLKENQVTATFFITAHYLNTQEELVKQMIDEGHIVGNHTVNHKSMPELDEQKIKSEIMDLHLAIYEKFGYEMKYMRPPKGEFSEKTLKLTSSYGYKTVMWSFAYEDWNENNQPNEEKAKEKVLANIHPGEIMLLHGNSKTNTNILDTIIKEIKKNGYEFKSLEEFEK